MAEVAKLVPRLKFNIKPRHKNLRNPEGPLGRIKKIRKSLAALFKYERIEMFQPRGHEVRGYAERLIVEAMRNGDEHPPTVDMVNFWLEDKQMVHKLFKVFVPRYQNYRNSFTHMHVLPDKCEQAYTEKHARFLTMCVLELKGNPYPPMPLKPKPDGQSLTNILLKEASKEFRKMNMNSANEDMKT